MRYCILAADYDGTLAHYGKVSPETIEALKRIKDSKRYLILVTGRVLPELKALFPEYTLFHKIVAENGALIYDPLTLEEKKLGEAPPSEFIESLVQKSVSPLSEGKVIVATWEPHHATVLETIKEFGLESQVIFNKGAVMILPAGINKAIGLETILEEMHLSMHNVVAIGDAENDLAMLQAAECSVAVANALDSVKNKADWVTSGDHGKGVFELVNALLENDLRDFDQKLQRHYIELGKNGKNQPFSISPFRDGIMIAGTSGGGKTTITSTLLEVMTKKKYQFCLIDPEGDYVGLDNSVILGTETQPPVVEEVKTLIQNPKQNIVVCIVAVPMADRPAFLNSLLPILLESRKIYGHPHWLICDEAHHLLPSQIETSFFNIPVDFNNFVLITTSPDQVNEIIYGNLNMLVATGDQPVFMIEAFASRKKIKPPKPATETLPKGEAWIWDTSSGKKPFTVQFNKPDHLLHRHKRKYSAGNMKENSFVFTGPDGKLKLKAYNLVIFVQLAEGVDDDTWMFHLNNNEYSNWLDNRVHDEELASLVRDIENNLKDPVISRKKIIELIKSKYTV
jgi:HAD superfamily hydrolase (TIGR01484 family)